MGKPYIFKSRPPDYALLDFANPLRPETTQPQANATLSLPLGGKKKKQPGTRLWMRFNAVGDSELLELDRNMIVDRVSIPARDLRILGPLFSHSSNILAREKAIVVNLEFIKAIITAHEVLILDPTNSAVLPFIDQLRQQLPLQQPIAGLPDSDHRESVQRPVMVTAPPSHHIGQWLTADSAEVLQSELPFELRVLEIALEVVCSFLDTQVSELEGNAYPALDELTRNVSTANLEHVRSLKSYLTRLLSRVQKVRDEMEHLLDDDQDMAQLYLTRKFLLAQQADSFSISSPVVSPRVSHISSRRSSTASTISAAADDHNVEELEMLLEAYFMQVDGTRNKLLSVREYIDDTEDYVNIQLDNQRNELILLHLTLTIAAFTIAIAAVIAGTLGMNIPFPLYHIHGLFVPVFSGVITACIFIFCVILGYARWKGRFGT